MIGNAALLVDLYELTMAQVYFRHKENIRYSFARASGEKGRCLLSCCGFGSFPSVCGRKPGAIFPAA